MKAKDRNRIIIALLLLATFIPVHVVKGLHHHECPEHSCHSDAQPSDKHSHDDCQICHFTFSPYITSDPVRLSTSMVFIQEEITIYLAGDYSTTSFSHYLRAPPAI